MKIAFIGAMAVTFVLGMGMMAMFFIVAKMTIPERAIRRSGNGLIR